MFSAYRESLESKPPETLREMCLSLKREQMHGQLAKSAAELQKLNGSIFASSPQLCTIPAMPVVQLLQLEQTIAEPLAFPSLAVWMAASVETCDQMAAHALAAISAKQRLIDVYSTIVRMSLDSPPPLARTPSVSSHTSDVLAAQSVADMDTVEYQSPPSSPIAPESLPIGHNSPAIAHNLSPNATEPSPINRDSPAIDRDSPAIDHDSPAIEHDSPKAIEPSTNESECEDSSLSDADWDDVQSELSDSTCREPKRHVVSVGDEVILRGNRHSQLLPRDRGMQIFGTGVLAGYTVYLLREDMSRRRMRKTVFDQLCNRLMTHASVWTLKCVVYKLDPEYVVYLRVV